MTPDELFAPKRREAENLIRQHAPSRFQAQLIAQLCPSIALNVTGADDTQIPIGASKFGGAPDVPENFEWPMWNDKPLGFLAQINLEEVAPFDTEGLLPKQGILSFFFFPYDYGYAENDASVRESWRVFHFQTISYRHPLPNELDTIHAQHINSCIIHPEAEWTLPPFLALEENDEEFTQMHEVFYKAFERPAPRHRLRGWYNSAGGSYVEELCAHYAGELKKSNAEEAQNHIDQWRLLLQADADHQSIGCEWGDMGALYFMIRQQELAANNFDNVWLIHECG